MVDAPHGCRLASISEGNLSHQPFHFSSLSFGLQILRARGRCRAAVTLNSSWFPEAGVAGITIAVGTIRIGEVATASSLGIWTFCSVDG